MRLTRHARFGALALFTIAATAAEAQLRVAVWNISNYGGGRAADLQTSIYGSFEGRSMSPDVIATQEFLSVSAVSSFLTILNTAPGSPGDWAAAPFIDGPDTDNAFFYRTSKVTLLNTVIAAAGAPVTTDQPRHTVRYDFRPVGYAAPETAVGLYSIHMKAGSASSDQSRRLIEAQRIRDNARGINTNGPGTALPAGFNFIVGGDFNIQSSSQAAYQKLVGVDGNVAGRFFDPIVTPGSWNNNGNFRFVHTQDPIGAGGMDDRHDQILISASLVDGAGLTYLGNPSVPYSTSTWNDPNHSYRSWGNDGTSFDVQLKTVGNTMVGPAIAQALKNVCNGAGHLPVFLDLLLPPTIDAPTIIDFGDVPQGSFAQQILMVVNDADVSLWGANGISDLNYSLSASAGVTAPVGSFVSGAGSAPNAHEITIDTSAVGPFNGTVTITSDAPDAPVSIVTIVGNVVVSCAPDVNGDGQVDILDLLEFLDAFSACDGQPTPCGSINPDFTGDGFVDVLDLLEFLDLFSQGC